MSGLALLVLDMQNDILNFHQRDDAVERVIRTVAGLAAWARSRSIPVVYARVAHRPSYVDIAPHLKPMIQGRGLLDQTASGSAIIDELRPEPGDTVVVKRRTGAFYGSDLEIVLRGLGAQTLLFTGKSTSRVVESTVREAHNRDFKCIVISDGCLAGSRELHENALKSMADWFAEVTTADDVKARFS